MPQHSRDASRLIFLKPVPQDFYEPTEPWHCNKCNEMCPYKHCPMCMEAKRNHCGMWHRCRNFCMKNVMLFVHLMLFVIFLIFLLIFVQQTSQKSS